MQYNLGQDTFFCSEKGALIKFEGEKRQEIKLDNLESSLLQLFIENAGVTLSKNDLMTVWRAQYVMEHSVTRVISTLRKKLGDTHQKASFIKTIPRAGYQYIGQVTPEQLETSASSFKLFDSAIQLFKQSSYLIISIQFFILVALIIFIVFREIAQKQDTPDSQYKPIIEISDNETLKLAPATTKDGEWIAYSAKNNENYWFLKFVNTHSGEVWQFGEQGYNFSSPAWLNNQSLVFRRWNVDLCEVRKITLDKASSIESNEIITFCNTSTQSKGLAVLNENEILVTDSDALTSPLQLQKVTIETGAKETIPLANVAGHGVFRIFVSPDKKYVATLISPNWFSTNIRIYDTKTFKELTWQYDVDYPLFSVALSNSLITFKNEYGGLSTVNYITDSSSKQYAPLLLTRAVYSPVYSPGGFLFTEGEMYSKNISFLNLDTSKSTILVDTINTSITIPTFIDSDTLLYVSNQTGINQVWRYQVEKQRHVQISKFTHPNYMYRIVLNNKRNIIAISTNKGIILAHFNDGYIGDTITTIAGKYPAFWQEQLIFNKYDDGRNAIYSYSLENGSTKLLINNGAYKTIVDQGKLYYSKFHKTGIWQFNSSSEDKLIFSDYPPMPPESWDVHEGSLYVGNQEESTIFRFFLETNESKKYAMKHCKAINIVADNQCIDTQVTPTVNRLLRFTFDL